VDALALVKSVARQSSPADPVNFDLCEPCLPSTNESRGYSVPVLFVNSVLILYLNYSLILIERIILRREVLPVRNDNLKTYKFKKCLYPSLSKSFIQNK
jgi:hypothetical protein